MTSWILLQGNSEEKTVDCVCPAVYESPCSSSESIGVLTTMDVRSSLSKRLMAWSNDLYMAAEMRWVMSLFRSIDLPSNWQKKRFACYILMGKRYFIFKSAHELKPNLQVCLNVKVMVQMPWLSAHYLRRNEGNVEHNSFLCHKQIQPFTAQSQSQPALQKDNRAGVLSPGVCWSHCTWTCLCLSSVS